MTTVLLCQSWGCSSAPVNHQFEEVYVDTPHISAMSSNESTFECFEKVAWTLTFFEIGSRGANVFALG